MFYFSSHCLSLFSLFTPSTSQSPIPLPVQWTPSLSATKFGIKISASISPTQIVKNYQAIEQCKWNRMLLAITHIFINTMRIYRLNELHCQPRPTGMAIRAHLIYWLDAFACANQLGTSTQSSIIRCTSSRSLWLWPSPVRAQFQLQGLQHSCCSLSLSLPWPTDWWPVEC